MPIEEIAEGLFKFLGRLLLQFFLEIILELLIKGPGYLIARLFFRKGPDVNGWISILFGILFWVAIIGGGYLVYNNA